MSSFSRKMRNKIIQEDISCLLEEIWYCELDQLFCKIFFKEAKKVICRVLDKYEKELLDLVYYEDNGNVLKLEFHEAVETRSMRHYILHLNEKGKFPSDPRTIDRNDYNNFAMYPYSHELFNEYDG